MPSHYAPQDEDNSRKYYYCGGLSRFHFWKKYLHTNQNDSDTRFIAQCSQFNLYPTYQRDGRVRRPPDYASDSAGEQLKPSVSYSTAMKWWSQYDIKFESRKCDICETCFSLKSERGRRASTAAEVVDAKKRLLLHQRLAQLAVWVRGGWKRGICLARGQRELLEIDFMQPIRAAHTWKLDKPSTIESFECPSLSSLLLYCRKHLYLCLMRRWQRRDRTR